MKAALARGPAAAAAAAAAVVLVPQQAGCRFFGISPVISNTAQGGFCVLVDLRKQHELVQQPVSGPLLMQYAASMMQHKHCPRPQQTRVRHSSTDTIIARVHHSRWDSPRIGKFRPVITPTETECMHLQRLALTAAWHASWGGARMLITSALLLIGADKVATALCLAAAAQHQQQPAERHRHAAQ
jgi:hypothetical protein